MNFSNKQTGGSNKSYQSIDAKAHPKAQTDSHFQANSMKENSGVQQKPKSRRSVKGNFLVNLPSPSDDQGVIPNIEEEIQSEPVFIETSVFNPEDNEAPGIVNAQAFKQSPLKKPKASISEAESNEWVPYQNCNYEMPFFQFTPLCYYRLHYSSQRILHKTIFRCWNVEVTVGGVCLALIFAILSLIGGYLSWTTKRKTWASGALASIAAIILFAFSSRNSIFTFISGVSFERLLIWHKLLGWLVLLLGLWHTFICALKPRLPLDGFLLLGAFAGIVVLSHIIKLFSYRLFLIFHRAMIAVVIVFTAMHKAYIIYVGVGLWGLDVVFRCVLMLYYHAKIKEVKVAAKSKEVIELSFERRDFKFKAGQYAFLVIPEVSIWEPHPFSISSSPEDPEVVIHVKIAGRWTKSLAKLASASKEGTKLHVYLDGPYGSPSIEVESEKARRFLFISGGIGVTPMRSIANSLLGQAMRGRKIDKVFFYWAVRNKRLVKSVLSRKEMLLRFNQLKKKEDGSKLVERHIYITSVVEPALEESLAEFREHQSLVQNMAQQKLELEAIFRRVRACLADEGGKRMSVLCCGPENMVKEASRMSRESGFEFHAETFDM